MQTAEQAEVDVSTMTGKVRSPTWPWSSQTGIPCTGPQRAFLSTPRRLHTAKGATGETNQGIETYAQEWLPTPASTAAVAPLHHVWQP